MRKRNLSGIFLLELLEDDRDDLRRNLPVLLAEKYEESMSSIIQRSMSERSREKCLRLHISGGHPIVECSHRVARRMCRHSGSKLRHQARLEYVQSTPNVATMHNGKHVAANSRGGPADVNGIAKVSRYVSSGSNVSSRKILVAFNIFQKNISQKSITLIRDTADFFFSSLPQIPLKILCCTRVEVGREKSVHFIAIREKYF